MRTRTWMGWALAFALLLSATMAFAQTPRRTEPGEPVIPDLGAPPVWEFVTITGQAPASTLGSMAARTSDGALFVWSLSLEPRVAIKLPAAPQAGVPREIDPLPPAFPGEGGPGAPDAKPLMTVSTLYQFSGGTWVPVLVAKDQTAHSVYVGPLGDIYANTNLDDGTFRIYHKAGTAWRVEPVAAGVIGPAMDFAGNGEAFMRAGNAILRHVDHSWVVAYVCEEFKYGDGLVDLGFNQIVAPCEGHEHMLNGTTWFTNIETIPTHIHSLWAGRDVFDQLHMFGGGADAANSVARIYQYVPISSLAGTFEIAREDAPFAGKPEYIGSVWGAGVHDVYAAGLENGFGILYHFNGAGWVNAAPEANLPEMKAVVGNVQGDLWVSLADGRLLHRPAVAVAPEEIGGPSPPIAAGGNAALREPLVTLSAPAAIATLRFTLPEARNVSFTFFDLGGRRIDVMDAGRLAAGVHEVTWNASRFANGVYFCRLEAGTLQATSRVLVRK